MALPKLRKVGEDISTSKKKKILLLSDDLRMHSGIGTVSREFVRGTVSEFDWIQIGGAIKHPDAGQCIDISADIAQQTGVIDASVKIYPVDGYGDPDLVRHLIEIENPDAIIHFTDPRFWGWLYAMEHELRQTMPLTYLNIWDDLPYPHWNENFYESCDLLMAISKQTYNINNNVCQRKPRIEGRDLTYVQHGINEKVYFPIEKNSPDFAEYYDFISEKGFNEYDTIFFFNSRNIRRKLTSNIILAFSL